ncbi:MAG: anti-sigma regulatory factor [Planctomycetaceae bacterium]|nr:anti-sigma regulatory factor [Planctomycetaceae bacterium]
MGQAPTTARLVLASRLEDVPRAEQAVMDAVSRHGFDQSSCFAIKLAVEEALINAIKHGNGGDESREIVVEINVSDKQACVGVTDEGVGFVPNGVPDPTLDENLEKPNGRGIMLMRAYMNEVTFNEAGNCVTMIKQRR